MAAADPRDQLRAVQIPVVSRQYCQERYEPMSINITDRMICAGFEEGYKGFCLLDNGGALVQFESGQPTLVGVASWGLCGMPEYPDIYANVASVRPWIKSVTGI